MPKHKMQKPSTVGGNNLPRCPKCARAGKATGAQQFRRVGGINRLHAHMIDASGHEWWDRSPAARKMGREEDARRKAAGESRDVGGLDDKSRLPVVG